MWLLILLLLIILLYGYVEWLGTYWKRKNVYALPAKFIFGNMYNFVTKRKHYGEVYDEIYRTFPNATYVGVYKLLNKPGILIRDLDLVKDVLVRDFTHFQDNEFFIDEKLDPLVSKNPFSSTGERWKIARNHIAPLFTPVRTKSVFPLINNVCNKFASHIQANIDDDFETKHLCSSYTLEVVSSSAFGIDAKTLSETDSEFQKMCDRVFSPNERSIIKTMSVLFLPFLSTLFRIPFIHKDIDTWVRLMIRDVIKNRDQNNEIRNDFLQSVLDLRTKNEGITEDVICGYALTFLFEGFETSSTLMAYALYELAANPHIQKMAQNEIDELVKNHDDIITDQAVAEMHYLDAILYETLRAHSPMLVLSKICTERYDLPPQYTSSDKRVTIEPGTSVLIPVYSIHHDPNVYSNPNKFDPERFLGENKKKHNKYAFLPFGEGPRICLGMRFGMAQSKSGIATILKMFNIKLSPRTEQPPKISKSTFLLACDEGIWIRFEKR